jgi:sugar/nucleoside kinase (ribokinase family)
MNSEPLEIIGVGNPFVDLIIEVTEEELAQLPGGKGGMIGIDQKMLQQITTRFDKQPLMVFGGSAANTTKGLTQFGHKTGLVGKVGQDSSGKAFVNHLIEQGVKPLLSYTETPTAQAACFITPDKERTMRSFLGASLEMKVDDLDSNDFIGVKLVHFEAYNLFNGEVVQRGMELAKQQKAIVSFDLGSYELVYKYKEKIIQLISRYVDILFANEEEIQALTSLSPEKACEVLRDLSRVAIVLMGKQGCLIGNREQMMHCPALEVEVLDTTGAGDLFASGFLHGYLRGLPIEECARLGVLTSSMVVQSLGAEISPTGWMRLRQIK